MLHTGEIEEVKYRKIHFQFLLGCYEERRKEEEAEAERDFQFLLGCYQVGGFLEKLERFFQFLLGCYKDT